MRSAFEIGIEPHRFWRMTLRTFLLCLQGYAYRRRQDLRNQAWGVMHQVNLWAKEPVTVAQLLGEEKPKKVIVDIDDWRNSMRAKRAEAAKKRKSVRKERPRE